MLAEIKRMPTEGAQETATLLRELADKLEEGKCRNIVVVADLTDEQSYIRSADWQDAWRLLGAIEYAKSAILRVMK